MKILNVKFKNMNTLKGEWELCFDRSPFKESGLFAITGPNGSGKSTIFDAISLGMYGEVVRQKHPTEQIISSQASDGYSMVTFSVNGNVFRSIWSLKAGTDEPPMPEMRLIELSDDETLLEENIVNVRNRVAELTGLDFKRFSRAVMLAQGEFAAFLKALDNERVDILEKIVGGHMYSSVLEDTIRQLEKADSKLIELKEKIQNVPLLHHTTVEALKETSRQLAEDLQATEQSITRLQQKAQQQALLNQLKKEYDENQIGLTAAQDRKKQMHADFLRLDKAAAAASFEKNLEQLGHERKRASEGLIALNQLNTDIARLEAQLTSLEERNEDLTLELDNDQEAWSQRFASIEGDLEMDQELGKISETVGRLVDKRSSINDERKTKRKRQLAIQQQISENNAQIRKTEKWLSKHSGKEDLIESTTEIIDKLETLQSMRNSLTAKTAQQKSIEKAQRKASRLLKKAMRKLEKRRKKAQKKKNVIAGHQQTLSHLLGSDSLEALARQMADQKTQMANYKAMLKIAKAFDKEGLSDEKTVATELKTAEKIHAGLLEKSEQEKKSLAEIKNIARFESCRKQLKENTPCPLCGSMDHPYVDREPPFTKGSLEALREQEEQLEQIEQQIKRHADQMAEIKRRHDRLVEIKNKWNHLSRSTGIEYRLGDRHSVLEGIEVIKQDRKKLKDRMKVIRKQTQKTDKHHSALKKILDNITEKQLLADKLQQDANGYKQTLASLQKEIQADRQQEAEFKQDLRRSITKFNETMPRSGQEAKVIKRLGNRRVDYVNHLKRQNELKAQAVVLKSNNEGLQKELERIEQDAKDLDEQINAKQGAYNALKNKREMAFGPGDALQEQQETEKALKEKKEKQESIRQEIHDVSQELSDKQRQKQAIEKTGEDNRHRYEDIEKQLLKRSVPLGFDTLADLQQSLMPSEQRQTLEQEKASIDQAINQYAANLEKIREKLDGEDPREMAAESEEDLRLQIEEAHKRSEELEQELAVIIDRLEGHKASEEAYDQLVQKMEKQKKIRDKIHEEKLFFESADDAEIRSRVREIMLEQLLEHSNRHLEELSGRYYLRRREANGLELEIEDVLQQRTRRPVDTLSGGESFLVSIAMALGLSDMSGNGQKIESLFIDEGFGYLDDETLYNVLSTLKNLKNNRKMVGIISHIKMLENEIPTKIKISQLPGGASRLDVVA